LVKISTGSLEKKGESVMFSPSEINLSINHSSRQMSRKPNMRNFSIKTVHRLTMTSFGPISTNPHLEGENVFWRKHTLFYHNAHRNTDMHNTLCYNNESQTLHISTHFCTCKISTKIDITAYRGLPRCLLEKYVHLQYQVLTDQHKAFGPPVYEAHLSFKHHSPPHAEGLSDTSWAAQFWLDLYSQLQS
jgi:hypothetical protein